MQQKKTFLKQKQYKLHIISKYNREKLMKNRNKNNYNNSKTELKDIIQCQRVISV